MSPVAPTTPQPSPPAVVPESIVRGPGPLHDSLADARAKTRAGESSGLQRVGSAEGLVLSRRDLEGFSADGLHEIASELEIPGRSSMRKDELVDALVASD